MVAARGVVWAASGSLHDSHDSHDGTGQVHLVDHQGAYEVGAQLAGVVAQCRIYRTTSSESLVCRLVVFLGLAETAA